MMLERHIQKIEKGQMGAYKLWEGKWAAIENRLGGFPAKSHYMLMSGSSPSGTVVWEREWPDFACAEAAYNKMFDDPEVKGLNDTGPIAEEWTEYYFKLED